VAFVGYLERGTRLAMHNLLPGADLAQQAPELRWVCGNPNRTFERRDQPPMADMGRVGCRNPGSLMPWPNSLPATARRQMAARRRP
jgi:hypothetical protein